EILPRLSVFPKTTSLETYLLMGQWKSGITALPLLPLYNWHRCLPRLSENLRKDCFAKRSVVPRPAISRLMVDISRLEDKKRSQYDPDDSRFGGSSVKSSVDFCCKDMVQTWLQSWVAQEIGLEAEMIQPGKAFLMYGMNSVQAMMLVGDLEDALGQR